MKRFFAVLLGLSILSPTAKSETITAFGISDNDRLEMLEEEGPTSVSRLSDFDTETGEHTNSQYFTGRGPGSFSAMERDGAGTLFVVQQPNRLLTLDETTGVATDVVTVTDGTSPYPFPVKIPAIAFAPTPPPVFGFTGPATLYAIIKREGLRVKGEGIDPPSMDYGFILVTIDTATGVTTDTGISIGGQNDGRGHGLIYDPDLDRLIHCYYAETPGVYITSGPTVEIINPDTGAIHVATYGLDFPEDEEVVLAESSVDSFTGMASLGDGEFIVYDNRGSDAFYHFEIEDLGVNNAAFGGKESITMEDYYFQYRMVGSSSVYHDEIRAIALTSDGNNLLAEMYGNLYTYTLDGDPIGDPIATSVGGYPLYLTSIATQPGTGNIYGLANAKRRIPEFQGNVKSKMAGSGVGLYRLDRQDPEPQELTDLDIEFFTNSGTTKVTSKGAPDPDSVNIFAIQSITFDELGNLYGFDADYGKIVRINLATGEVTALTEHLKLLRQGDVQLEYNPEDGLFYILSYGGDFATSSADSNLMMTTVARDGTTSNIPLTGDYPDMMPNSFVYAGAGNFFFTMSFPYGPGEDFTLTVDTLGYVEVVSGPEPTIFLNPFFTTTGLSRAGKPATADVSVGQKRSRLRGNNIYNSSGARQRISFTTKGRLLKASFYAKVENDGNYPGDISIRGSRVGRRDSIRYTMGGRNQTAAILRGASHGFDAKEAALIKVSLFRRGGGRWVNNTRISANYGRARDVGKVRAKLLGIKKRGGSLKPRSL